MVELYPLIIIRSIKLTHYPQTVLQKKYVHTDNGFNMKMTNIHAAIGLAQLKKEHIFMKICDIYLKKKK